MAASRIIRMSAAVLILTAIVSVASAFPGRYQVDRVVSGTTMKVENNAGAKFIVKLVALQVPKPEGTSESSTPSELAKQHLTQLVGHKTVYVKSYGADESGRIRAEVFLRDRNVGLEMVAAGLAEVNQREAAPRIDLEPYHQAELAAKVAQRGIWARAN